MQPFVKHTGIVAPLDRANVDTDQIIPKQFLKLVERTGFGRYLFYDWRYHEDGSPRADFVLNEPGYQGASILVAGKNFGSGSSREHAPWALLDFGFRAILAPSFADIFYNNCLKNGLLPVVLPEDGIARILAKAKEKPGWRITVDLAACRVYDEGALSFSFSMDEFQRRCLLEGLDEIALTLQHEAEIGRFEAARPSWLPSLSPSA
ncbi:MAG: 3-isopropylmalate dehydratase small subunit [Chthonomonadales bacterium]